MSYGAAIDELNALAPELLTQPGQPRRKFSLGEIGVLLEALGNPQQRFPAVLIAGTNGKGSTAATLASILTEAGLRTGLYTSPHLERPNERIRINGAEIGDEDFARRFFAVREKAQRLTIAGELAQLPSFFETLTAMAFMHFAAEQVEIAVLEVGMGGRLDATNIVDPLVSVITDISLDHTEWLGSTVGAIAREKAGILRPNGVLVTLPQHPEANQALGEVAMQLEVRGVSAAAYMPPLGPEANCYQVEVLGEAIEVDSPLVGSHQRRNVALAIAAAVELAERRQVPVTPKAIEQGIRKTSWPGRLERIEKDDVTWILDVAHNPAGAWALRAGLRDLLPDVSCKVFVFNCLKDKAVDELAQILFPLFDEVIFAPIHSARATATDALLKAAEGTGARSSVAGSLAEALAEAHTRANGGVVVVAGSVYLVGAARSVLLGHAGGRLG